MLQYEDVVLLLGLLCMLTMYGGAWRAQITEFGPVLKFLVNLWVIISTIIWILVGVMALAGISLTFLRTPSEYYSWSLLETEMSMIALGVIAWMCYHGMYAIRRQVLARRDAREIVLSAHARE